MISLRFLLLVRPPLLRPERRLALTGGDRITRSMACSRAAMASPYRAP